MEDGIRINRYLSDAGQCSRREADKWIEDGKVLLDGKVAGIGDKVYPGMKVTIAGEEVAPVGKHKYIMLNKPVGIVSTADREEKDNVVSFIDHDARIYPIGRLDKDSEGLLLLTNDGEIVNKILRADQHHEKEYEVAVDRPITPRFVRDMSAGVEILGTKTLPCKVVKISERRFSIVLTQGLNRQIRRMCDALGYNVISLRRVRIMHIRLGNLKVGQWRNLSQGELDELKRRLEETPAPSTLPRRPKPVKAKFNPYGNKNDSRGGYGKNAFARKPFTVKPEGGHEGKPAEPQDEKRFESKKPYGAKPFAGKSTGKPYGVKSTAKTGTKGGFGAKKSHAASAANGKPAHKPVSMHTAGKAFYQERKTPKHPGK